jgi:hypothetical protein
VGTSGSGEGEWEGKVEWIISMYFIYLYENRTVKPDEAVLRRRLRNEGEW